MKKIGLIFLFFIYAEVLFAFGPRLFLSGQKDAYKVEDIGVVLDTIRSEDPAKNILFYIHGRGKHPAKGINYLPDFEERYGIRVIMFTWSSWINTVTRPVASAEDAARELDTAFNSLSIFKELRPEFFKKRKLSFLAHSMGNIVVKNFLESFYQSKEYSKSLFNTFVLNAPDTSLIGHHKWLEKIDFSPNIYVTYNKDDIILIASKILDFSRFRFFSGPRLGSSITVPFIKSKLANNTLYLNFSKLTSGGHSHHRSNRTDGHFLNMIFNYLTNGLKIPLDKSIGVYKIKKQVVYFKRS